MINNIFDSHAHYDDSQFDPDRYELLDRLFDSTIAGIVNCASDLKTSITSLDLSKKYPCVYAAAGIHPHEAQAAKKSDYDIIFDMLKSGKCVAAGEIGLDYHYDFSPREIQKECFERQLCFAAENNIPVIIHDREAHEDTLNLLKKYRPKGVVHCFSGSVEMAKEILKLGMYIGLGGAVTFKNAKKAVSVAEIVPSDRLLIETDCPYMAPVPHRGERNDSSLIEHTAQRLGEIRGVSAQEIADLTNQNAKTLFKI